MNSWTQLTLYADKMNEPAVEVRVFPDHPGMKPDLRIGTVTDLATITISWDSVEGDPLDAIVDLGERITEAARKAMKGLPLHCPERYVPPGDDDETKLTALLQPKPDFSREPF
jgi:hypothetical protein